MLPTLAQVLNTLAHELRTPVAISQGYLRLYLEGRLAPDDQRKGLQQTADAVKRLADLCGEVGTIAALSESKGPPVKEQVPAELLLKELRAMDELSKVTWLGESSPSHTITTDGRRDLMRAFASVARQAVDDARGRPTSIHVSTAAGGLRMLVGTETGLAALATGPEDAGATEFDLMRGGRGLALIWAAFILSRSNVHIWQHSAERAAIGFHFHSQDL